MFRSSTLRGIQIGLFLAVAVTWLAPPAAAQAVKDWLASAARMTAEAGRDGAVLGIGGERVGGAESKALAEVGLALGVTI